MCIREGEGEEAAFKINQDGGQSRLHALHSLGNNSRILAVQLSPIFKFETCDIRPSLRREKKKKQFDSCLFFFFASKCTTMHKGC